MWKLLFILNILYHIIKFITYNINILRLINKTKIHILILEIQSYKNYIHFFNFFFETTYKQEINGLINLFVNVYFPFNASWV